MCEWPKTTACASGKRVRIRCRRPRAAPASWIIAIRTPSRCELEARGQAPAKLAARPCCRAQPARALRARTAPRRPRRSRRRRRGGSGRPLRGTRRIAGPSRRDPLGRCVSERTATITMRRRAAFASASMRRRDALPPGSTASESRPRGARAARAPTSSRRQPRSVRTSASLAGAARGHDRLQVRAGGEQLVGEARLAGAGPQQRLAERHERRVVGARRGRARCARGRVGGRWRPRRDGLEQVLAAAPRGAAADAADALELGARGGLALGDLHQRGVAEDALHGAVVALGGALAPLDELARDGPRGGAQPGDARQALEDRLGVALVAGARQRLRTPRAPTPGGRCRSGAAAARRRARAGARRPRARRRAARARGGARPSA